MLYGRIYSTIVLAICTRDTCKVLFSFFVAITIRVDEIWCSYACIYCDIGLFSFKTLFYRACTEDHVKCIRQWLSAYLACYFLAADRHKTLMLNRTGSESILNRNGEPIKVFIIKHHIVQNHYILFTLTESMLLHHLGMLLNIM